MAMFGNLNPPDMVNMALLEQIGLLRWSKTGDSKMTGQLAQVRVGYELYQRLSGEREIDALRNATILGISKWVQEHPKASKQEMLKEIGRQIQEFAHNIENL